LVDIVNGKKPAHLLQLTSITVNPKSFGCLKCYKHLINDNTETIRSLIKQNFGLSWIRNAIENYDEMDIQAFYSSWSKI